VPFAVTAVQPEGPDETLTELANSNPAISMSPGFGATLIAMLRVEPLPVFV